MSAALSALAEEEARKVEKPIISAERATALALELYGLRVVDGSIKELDSYDDRNFYLRARHERCNDALVDAADANSIDGEEGVRHFVLKVHNGIESLDPAFVECQNFAMAAVRAGCRVWCPRALPALDGTQIAHASSTLANGTERNHAVRCLPFRPGSLLADVALSPALLKKLGTVTAQLSSALATFDHPAAHRPAFIWDLANAPAVRPLLKHSPPERHAVCCLHIETSTPSMGQDCL